MSKTSGGQWSWDRRTWNDCPDANAFWRDGNDKLKILKVKTAHQDQKELEGWKEFFSKSPRRRRRFEQVNYGRSRSNRKYCEHHKTIRRSSTKRVCREAGRVLRQPSDGCNYIGRYHWRHGNVNRATNHQQRGAHRVYQKTNILTRVSTSQSQGWQQQYHQNGR